MQLKGKSAVGGIAAGKVFVINKDDVIPRESYVNAEEAKSHLDHYLTVKKLALDELEKIKISMQKFDPAKAAIITGSENVMCSSLFPLYHKRRSKERTSLKSAARSEINGSPV